MIIDITTITTINHITNIGLYLKDIRKNKKISQKEAAEKLGFSQTWLSLIETGIGIPSLQTIDKLFKLYDIRLSIVNLIHKMENEL